MFYFDEDHMEHGFNAPTSIDHGCTQREITNRNHHHDTTIGLSNIATVGCFNFDHRGTTAAFGAVKPLSSFRSSISDNVLALGEAPLNFPTNFVPGTGAMVGVEEEMNENFNGHVRDFAIVQDVLSHDRHFGLKSIEPEKRRVSSKQFILGDDEDGEFFSEESDSDGGTAGFPLDEDSGIGFSAPNSVSDDAECMDEPAELIPLRSLNIGSVGRNLKPRRRKLRFQDFYKLTDDHLGSGAYASVRTAVQISTGKEFAVKLVDKHERGHTRTRIMREVDTFNMCRNHPNIVQLIEWFEDEDYFYMIFEKMRGGPLLNHIQRKGCFTECEASQVTKDIVMALKFLHDRGIAHRDVKPENILCTDPDYVSPVKLCDLDLASKPQLTSTPRTLPSVNSEPNLASPVGSAEFMAPEVVDTFVGDALKYDKRCDMWSVGVIIYIMLCGYPPFFGECDRENCGWDQGEPCNDCQDNLFHRIQRGRFEFPEEEWEDISYEAKDLISHLLVKNVRKRYTADDVLKHPWIVRGAPKTPLQTPNNLLRNDSAREIHQINEHFNVMNRFGTRLSTRSENTGSESGSPPSSDSPLEDGPPSPPPLQQPTAAPFNSTSEFPRIHSPY